MNNSTEALNLTKEDPLDDPDESPSRDHITAFLLYRFTLHVICLIADALILYAVFSFKNLRSDDNRFIIHRSLINILHIVLQPIVHLLILEVMEAPYVPCFLSVASTTLLVMTLLLPYGLFISYVVQNFKYRFFERHEVFLRKYLIWSMYGAGVIEYILEYTSCRLNIFHILASSFEIVIICTIFLNLVKWKFCLSDEKASSKIFMVHVANVCIFSFLPMLLYHQIINYLLNVNIMRFFISTRYVPEFFAYANSPFVIFILCRYNKDFNTAFLMIWRKVMAEDSGDTRWTGISEDGVN